MARGDLPFQYGKDDRECKVRSLRGLPAYLDLVQGMNLAESRHRHVRLCKVRGLERRTRGDVFDFVKNGGM